MSGGTIKRRAVISAVGAGIAALAGCTNSGGSGNPTGTPTNNGSTATEPGQSKSATQSSTGGQYAEPEERSAERQFEQELLNNEYGFIEIAADDIQMSKMQQTPTPDEPDDPYELLKYHFRDFYARNGDDGDSIIFGYDMEPSGDSRNMLFKDFAESASAEPVSDSAEFGYSGTYKETAIRRFFNENVSGVVDVSENFPGELLEIAAQ
jgi:hypothetical protein